MKRKIDIFGIILLVLSLILTVGVKFIFHACEVHENPMVCHWAERSVLGVGIVLSVISILHLIVKDIKAKLAISLAIAPTAVYAALIPGVLIKLCTMATMRCRIVFRPAVFVISILIFIVAVADVAVTIINNKKAASD